jgi:SAM-dependent methyltransferase
MRATVFPALARPAPAERGGIPRYVTEHYADSFGEQWNRYRRVQLDSATRQGHSRHRFYDNTGWTAEEIAGEQVLEVGCGAGRFTEILLEAGANVTAVDASSAVDACATNIGPHERLRIVQADLFDLPFTPGSFDRVFCYGVLQHTPDPERAFRSLVEHVRPDGAIAADVYRKQPYIDRWSSKYLWRPLTTRMPRDLLRRIIEWYVPRWLSIDTRLARVPRLGRFLVAVVPCWNYTGLLDLTPEQLCAWAVLDTFDALSPRYDIPQTVESVRGWCDGLVDVDVRYGGNGVLINARRPAT